MNLLTRENQKNLLNSIKKINKSPICQSPIYYMENDEYTNIRIPNISSILSSNGYKPKEINTCGTLNPFNVSPTTYKQLTAKNVAYILDYGDINIRIHDLSNRINWCFDHQYIPEIRNKWGSAVIDKRFIIIFSKH